MADDNIEIRITASDEASAKLVAAGKNVEDLGKKTTKTSDVAKMGYKAIGEAAEKAAESLGVGGREARKMGNAIEDFLVKQGPVVMAFGVMTVAAGALYAVYKHNVEEQKKISEENIKMADTAASWVESAIKEKEVTTGLIDEKRKLLQLEFDINKERLEKGIKAQKELIEGLRKQHEEAWKLRDRLSGSSDTGQSLIGALLHGKKADRQAALEDVRQKIDVATAELMKLQDAYGKMTSSARSGLGGAPKPAYSVSEFEQIQNASRIEMLRQQVDALDSFYTYSDDMRRADEAREEKHQQQLAQIRLQGSQMMAAGLANTFQTMYQIGGKHARQYFSLWKSAAIAETIISTYQAAQKAYAFGSSMGPGMGAAMAAIATAAGMARVAAIRATEFNTGGGSAGGGGEQGSAAVTPAGYPFGNTGSGSVHLTISINGQQAGTAELTGEVLRTIYNNNGSVNGYSVTVERSA